ncbi:hypothetical protein Tco_1064148, partial [Tanacetum coccineum]
MHGFDVYHFANENLYNGAWHKGRKQDFGVNDFRYEDIISSYWDNGVLIVSTSQDTSQVGSSSTTISHAKVLESIK